MGTKDLAAALVQRHGKTYCEQAGIRLKDTPSRLYQLLVLSTLLSARISADVAVSAARQLFRAGMRTPRAMADASWQQRVDALGRGHYRRYDERTSTMLGRGAELVEHRWKGDVRRLHTEGGDAEGIRRLLKRVPGIGDVGAHIFCREAQAVWPDLRPYVDERTAKGATRLGLPAAADTLTALVPSEQLPALIAGCVRASLSVDVVRDVKGE